MKKSINIWAATITAALTFVSGVALGSYNLKHQMKLIDSYRSYVVSTEHLLDLINDKLSWVDAFDHDGYYESRAEVFHLDSVGLKREKERQERCFQMNAQMFNN